VRPDAIAAIEDWVTRQRRFWNASFNRLEQMVADDGKQSGRNDDGR
jgi:hypothetical protein